MITIAFSPTDRPGIFIRELLLPGKDEPIQGEVTLPDIHTEKAYVWERDLREAPLEPLGREFFELALGEEGQKICEMRLLGLTCDK